MRLALHIFLFLALMDPFAILALLPGGDAVSDHGNLSGDSADADGGADAVSDQGNLLPGGDAVSADADGGADAVSDQGNLSADADGGADDQIQQKSVRQQTRRQADRTRIPNSSRLKAVRSKVQLRMKAQALRFNNSGAARTYDHLMPVPETGPATRKRKASGRDIGGGGAVPAIMRGKGRYKSSTPEYIGKMAFAATDMSFASVDQGWGWWAHARGELRLIPCQLHRVARAGRSSPPQ